MLRVIPLTDVLPSEIDWLKVLFSDFEQIEWCPYVDPVPIEDNALYMYNLDSGLSLPDDLLAKLETAKGIGLLHLGDEYLRSGLTEYASFSYVIRMFPYTRAEGPGVMTVPIGYTRNLGPEFRKLASDRKLTWMFAGDWKSDRGAMAKQFQHWPGGLLSMPMPYQDEGRISRQEYLERMADAAFAPCPAGNIVLETCRPYEALHFGAIPLLPKRRHADPYHAVFGDHPLPTFEDWGAALKFAKDVYASPDTLNALQAECLDWWDSAQAKWATDLKTFIEEGQADTYRAALQARFSGRPVSKLERFRELLTHQNRQQFQSRIAFRVNKLTRKLTGKSAAKPTWSFKDIDESGKSS